MSRLFFKFEQYQFKLKLSIIISDTGNNTKSSRTVYGARQPQGRCFEMLSDVLKDTE